MPFASITVDKPLGISQRFATKKAIITIVALTVINMMSHMGRFLLMSYLFLGVGP